MPNYDNPFAINDTDDESSYQHSILGNHEIPLTLGPFEHEHEVNGITNNIHGHRRQISVDQLQVPTNSARIISSPRRYDGSHNIRDSTDPFNTAFDDDDDDDAIGNGGDYGEREENWNPQEDMRSVNTFHNYSLDSNIEGHPMDSVSMRTNKTNGVNVYEYDHSDNSNMYETSTANILNAHGDTNSNFEYSPAHSNQQLNQYNNSQSGDRNLSFHRPDFSYYSDEFSPIFQDFERDIDEPELDNNDLFQDEVMNDQNDLKDGNFADKCDNRVELIDGKYYSFDYPVPSQLLNRIPFNGAKNLTEFNRLRYHAITADPKDYTDEDPIIKDYIQNYPLRQNIYPIKRDTELMIVCTMYNEDEILLARTLKGVFKNIKTMYNLKENKDVHPWGKDSWKKIVVVIVSDGKLKIDEKSKALLTLLGAFQEGIMQESVNNDKVNAHLFEYTSTFGIGKFDYNRENHSYNVPLVTEQTIPVQLMFLLKEENKQKINSHRWALNFLCPNLNPKVVVLLDVGTEPGPDSIFKLWKAFKDPKVGGACGEIRAMLGNHASPNDESSIWRKIGRFIYFKFSDFVMCTINPLVAAQNFEYKMSNILDKPMESSFGFVTVLPGAFSAYRYEALKGEPLRAYFHGEDMKSATSKPAGILESNMYLAEDRILCFELVAKSEKSYLLKYVHNSYAVTDVPSHISEFVNQRRRWLNGSFFAALYSNLHFYRLLKSTHSIGRKIALVIEVIYQTINILLSWFSLSIYFLVFRILTQNIRDTFVGEKVGNILAIVFLWVYIAAFVLTFIISFGNKPNDAKYLYLLVFALFACVVIYMTFCVIVLTIESVHLIKQQIGDYSSFTASIALKYFENSKFRDLTVSLASTYALYLIGSLIFFDVFHLIACTIPYVLLSPAYINVLSVFAFCNINDISWGTKGSVTIEAPKKKAVNDDNDEKNILLLSENLENPDDLFKKAQLCMEGKNPDNDGEKAAKLESDLILENIKKSEKNYALGRTYTVSLWLICNFILLVIILSTGGLEDYSDYKNGTDTSTSTSGLSKRSYWNNMNVANIFMTVILWLVAALALVRLIGCIYYRISFFFKERKFHRSLVV